MHNNRRLWKQSVILNEGDIVEIGGQGSFVVPSLVLTYLKRRSSVQVPSQQQAGSNHQRDSGTKNLTTSPSPPSLPLLSHNPSIYQTIGNYIVFDRLLGSGAFCVVRLALNTKSLKQVACKVLKRATTSTNNISDLQREVEILKGLKHVRISV